MGCECTTPPDEQGEIRNSTVDNKSGVKTPGNKEPDFYQNNITNDATSPRLGN